LCYDVLHLSQVIAKVSRLDILRREMISGLFYEMLGSFIETELDEFSPSFKALPLPGRDELEVTCRFDIVPHPVFLFAARSSSGVRLATLSFLEFQKENLRFTGCIVHDNFDNLSAKDRKRITSAADKQFVSLEDFKLHGKNFLSREAA
jgi:hypothetical protein